MAATTPRRSLRIPHTHTPKMTERKKTLFVENEAGRESLTKHRHLPVVESESDSDDCDLGIISTLDSSSSDETDQNVPKTPERSVWHDTRSHKSMNSLKNFMKSPFTLNKYQTRHSCPEAQCGSLSTPATPHIQHHPGTPSSTHSCASAHTVSSTSSKARKSLASLIADTESCSSSLKDLNFDTDSGTDSKENTPTKTLRRSARRRKMTPKFQSFKGILVEQKKNVTPIKNAVVCLTKMDLSSYISPTQMLKTPHNSSENNSPPKRHRRSVIEIAESPESCGSEKSYKRLHYEGMTDIGPIPKQPRLDPSVAPKARLSLFNSDRLKEILSTKSFYGKSNPDLNTTITTKLSNAIETVNTQRRRPFSHSHSHRRKRKPGQINMGVRHRIRKPKIHKSKIVSGQLNNSASNTFIANASIEYSAANKSVNKDVSILSQSSVDEKADPFDKEKQTIEALLSQWTEEEVPESELIYTKPQELPCFNSTVIEATNQIFQPVTAVPVTDGSKPLDSETVIVELGTRIASQATNLPQNLANMPENVLNMPGSMVNTSGITMQHLDNMPENMAGMPENVVPQDAIDLPCESGQDVMMLDQEGHTAAHGEISKDGQYLPVEGGYIFVDGTIAHGQKEIPDLDEIEREMQMLDEQILQMAQSNNINAEAILASTETEPVVADVNVVNSTEENKEKSQRLFAIFSEPNPGISTPRSKRTEERSKKLLKSGNNQYIIDAGQKKIGATQCTACGVIYQIGDPQDEHDHLVHHDAIDVLRFNGWKEECIVDKTETGRCIKIRGGESGWKRVESVLARVVHPQLGYAPDLPRKQHTYTAYLFIEKRQIVGCLIMEPKSRAYKLLPGEPDCCSVKDYPVKCGVSRIWTHKSFRRRGIAVRLLECARASLLHGMAVLRSEVAFSAPTPAGKALATSYCGTPNFYVYLD
ncbi:N-acetyltransferase eco-like isoform X1 [Maniola hyperantus]|uniref:N-acetyltransferase eco-like isoform X1 n=2 Tax=Aphantopus hyperantus TaxID=2795564 RepID=UPI0015683298|nr:uncharacterized protein LOC117983486 [Maniola hyperantus]